MAAPTPQRKTALAEASCPVERILDAHAAGTFGVVKADAMLVTEFRRMGMMYDKTIRPQEVGFDPLNRNGEGGNALEVHTLTQDIAFLGFAWSETAHACCIEEAPGQKYIEDFNRALCSGTDLAPVPVNSIHYGSLACGHTNQGLRAIAAGLPSSCPLRQ